MFRRKNDFIKIDHFQVFPVLVVVWLGFSIKIDVLALNFTKSPNLGSFGPAETLLMLWLYENGVIKRAAFSGSCRHNSQN